MRLLLRVIVGSLIAAIVSIAAIPIFVLRDLNSGGTGWGLCPDGIGDCFTSYFAGFELVAFLLAAVFVVLGLLRVAIKTLHYAEHRYDRRRSLRVAPSAAGSTPPRADTGVPVEPTTGPVAGDADSVFAVMPASAGTPAPLSGDST